MEFYESMQGKIFFENTMPNIEKSLQSIADSTKRIANERSGRIAKKDEDEFVGQIIDVFDDYIGSLSAAEIDKMKDVDAIITGMHYDKLSAAILNTLKNWGVVE